MQEVSFETIEQRARELSEEQARWHFHIMTPGCMLNESDQHAFVLEGEEVLVAFSATRNMELGKKLVKLLHKDDSIGDESGQGEPSAKMVPLLQRAQQLNAAGIPWHHHMLFPDCAFNPEQGWCVMLEDPDQGEVLSAVYDQEPIADLSHLEKLFYDQSE